ncbi:protein FAR1-RELATED SEQUENCE 5-like [Lolium perenne]|uniref:protein FAR1-RELATED SEQUENCE 5-like n=1 Tax=Lolium perenne TaxID=4522 RepID=UPI0021F52652|nr:protein FAR1-RELATED SEQUENCE 5-like [Lolium perenne]
MEFWFPGIDLNKPVQDEGYDQGNAQDNTGQVMQEEIQHEHEATGQGEQATGNSGMDAGASVESVDADTGNTMSTDDSGEEDEVQSTPSLTPVEKPYPNMLFASWEEAKMCYNRYAKHVGFSIKSSTSRKSTVDKQTDKYLFVCNKSGKNVDINKQEVPPVRQRNRTITKKTDCKARLRVKRRGDKWRVTMSIEEHNHACIKKFSLKRFLRSHKGIPKEEREFVKLLHKVNLSAGRVMTIMAELYGKLGNVPYERKDVSNYMASIDTAARKNNDMSKLLAQFEEVKVHDPEFFKKIDLDHDDRVRRIFWVDGPARAAYKKYNDCLSFDATYMTNCYSMPFAPFIGINRYGQSIQLGCGFLRNEQIEDYVWLFEAFLEAMDGVQPINIITDQDASMRSAILSVFPDCCHRNCRWHIMQNAQGVLGNDMAKNEPLRLEFNATIDYSMTVEEFETRWAEMILKHNVADNTHLQDIYDMRASFVPAYFKDRFFPFLQTTARSEGFNAVLKRYVTPHHSLSHFFEQYMKLQEKIDVAEDSNEFKEEDKIFRFWGEWPLEEHAFHVYTMPIYLRFRAELRKVTSYNATHVAGQIFYVVPVAGSVFGYGKRTYRVEANSEEGIYICECSKINRDGLLCCHALRVMAQLAESEKATALAEKYMRELGKELAAMKISAAAKRKDKKQPSKNDGVTPETEIGGDGGQGSSTQYEHVRDPILTTTKGRPEEKRKKSGLHLKASKPQKCRGCGSAQHSTSECPSKITPAPEQKEFDFFRDMV